MSVLNDIIKESKRLTEETGATDFNFIEALVERLSPDDRELYEKQADEFIKLMLSGYSEEEALSLI